MNHLPALPYRAPQSVALPRPPQAFSPAPYSTESRPPMSSPRAAAPLGGLGGISLTAKLSMAATALCVCCVVATSAVLGWQTATTAAEQADQSAVLAARDAAGNVAVEMGHSFSAVKTLADTMRGMKASGVTPSREQLDAMARQVLTQHPEFIGTYSI